MGIVKRVGPTGKISYRVKVTRGYVDGVRLPEVTVTCANKKEALAAFADITTKVANGTYVAPTKLTVKAFLAQWLEKTVATTLKRQTFDLYTNVARIYIEPALKDVLLNRLTPWAIQDLYTAMALGQAPFKKPFSRHSIKNVSTVLRSSLKQAVRWRLITHNPALDVDLPRQQGADIRRRKTVRSFDPKQANDFLDACLGMRLGVLLMFALLTGARPGEYLALFWSDIDWTAGTVKIDRSIIWPRGGGWQFDTPKTESSYRTISLPRELMAVLKRHRAKQLEERMALGPDWTATDDWIFPNADGSGPIQRKHLHNRDFRNALKKAKLPATFVLYDLRHTCATLLLLEGEPAKVVAERLGHSSVTTTLDVYSHVLPHMQERATEKLRGLLMVGR